MDPSVRPRYLEQYNRVQRAQARVLALAEALGKTGGTPQDHLEYEDAVIAFFQNAWHLKDWIKNDPSVAEPIKSSVLSRFEAAVALAVCADVANGTKHLKLTRRRLGASLHKLGASNSNKNAPEWEVYISLPQMPGQASGLHAAGAMAQVMSELEHTLRPNGLLRGAS
ncbi:MAG: hypothetical protein ABIU97_00670 [Dehalococcoidia bacterium]